MYDRSRQLTRIVVGLCAFLPGAGLAQEGTVEEVEVRGRWDDPLGSSSSASHGVVGAEEIDFRPRLRTGEILEVVPGLIVTQHSGTGKSNQMFLRGFNLDHGTDFATWVDGMPVNMPTHGHGQGYTDLNFLIPELVERVEYRKGAYYADVSDFSPAGAAHLSTFRSLDEGFVKAGLGENGYVRLLAADSFAAGSGEWLYGVQSHAYDGPWHDVSEDLDRKNALLRYSHGARSDAAWNLALMAYDADWRSADQIPRRAVERGLVSPLGSLDRTLGGASSRYSMSGSWQGTLAGARARAVAYAIDYDLSLFSNFTYFLDDPVDGDQFEQRDDRTVQGGELEVVFDGRTGGAHRVGASLRHDDIGEVGLFRTVARERRATVRRDSVDQRGIGVYYSHQRSWSSRLRTELGVRADHYAFDVASDLAVNSGSSSELMVSPKASLIYAVDDGLEVYLSAGKGFHSNDARGTTIAIDPASGDPAERVSPLVDSHQLEVGFRMFRRNRLNVSAALWYLELDSELLFVGDAGTTEASRASRRYGIEVPVYYRLGDRVTLDVELALTDSRFTEDDPSGNAIPGAIDTVLAAGVSWSGMDGFYGSVRLRRFGPRPLVEDGSVESSASTVLGAMLGFARGRFDVRLEVLNLLDSDDDDITYFYASRLPGEPAGGIEDLHFHPIEPRTARVHLNWRF